MYIARNGSWKSIPQFFIARNGSWKKISIGYIARNGVWKRFFVSEAITPNVAPSMTSNGSSTDFYGGFNLSLTRGSWSGSPDLFTMQIQRSLNPSSGFVNVSTGSFTDLNSTSSSSIAYSLTDLEAKTQYYFRGYVKAENVADFYEYYTPTILSRISFAASMNAPSNITQNGATFSWTLAGVPDNTYYYSQQLDIVRSSDNVVVYTANPTVGNTSIIISNPASILSNTSYYARLTVIANDGWRTSGSPSSKIETVSFTTLGAAPENIVAPTFSPLNNRSGIPMGVQQFATTGTWNNVNAQTVYTYQWKWTGGGASPSSTNNYFTFSTGAPYYNTVGQTGYVEVKATNTDGQFGIGIAAAKTIDSAVANGVTSFSPNPPILNQQAILNSAISGYPTSYVINWGDGTSYNSSSITTQGVLIAQPHTYTSTGIKNVSLISQPGNVSTTISVDVQNRPGPFTYSISDGTETPVWPSGAGINISGTSGTMTVTWNPATYATAGNLTGETAYGDQVFGVYNSTLYRTDNTSDTWPYSASGNEYATVYAYNYNKKATISWAAASNAGSYIVNYTVAVPGVGNVTQNSAALTSTSLTITLGSAGGSVTVNSVTAYINSNGTGNSTSGTLSGSSSVTPTFKSTSETSGNFYLEYNVVGAPTITSSSSTSSTITLNFIKGSNAPSTRAYIGTSFDGSTSGTSYTFYGLSASTQYLLKLYGYDGTTESSSYAGGYYTTSGVSPTPQPTPQPLTPQPLTPQPLTPQPLTPQPLAPQPQPQSQALCGINCAGEIDGNPCSGLCAI